MKSEAEIMRRLNELENAALRPLGTFGPVPKSSRHDPTERKERAWRRFVRKAEIERDVLRWVVGQ